MPRLRTDYIATNINTILSDQDRNSIRQYDISELVLETASFFGNKDVYYRFSKRYSDSDDYKSAVKYGEDILLSLDQLHHLKTSDCLAILYATHPYQMAEMLAEKNDRNIDSIWRAISSGQKLPPPIIIESHKEIWLVSGNTRMMAYLATGINPYVRVIK